MTPENMPEWFVPFASPQDAQLRSIRFDKVFSKSGDCEVGSTKYQRYLRSRHWFNFRKSVLILSNFKCVGCGEEAHQVHHKTYARLWREKFEDVEPVCELCHHDRHPGTTHPAMKDHILSGPGIFEDDTEPAWKQRIRQASIDRANAHLDRAEEFSEEVSK